MRFRNAVVFVTGGAGFIGSAVVRHLLDETEAFVVNIDKLTYAATLDSIPQASGHPRYRFVQADICDGPALRQLFEKHQPRHVMNLAAESHVDRSIDAPAEFVQTNIVGTFTLLQEALRYWHSLDRDAQGRFRFHHVSTDEVYGSLGPEGLFAETSPCAPSSPYAASKASSDHLVRAWRATYELPTPVTNCSTTTGRITFPRSSFPTSSSGAWRNSPSRSTATAATCAIGCMWRTTPGRSLWCSIAAPSARPTISGPATSAATSRWCRRSARSSMKSRRRRPVRAHGSSRTYATGPDTTGATRSILRRSSASSAGAPPRHSSKTVRWYLDNRPWWQSILDRGYRAERIGLDRSASAEIRPQDQGGAL